jgi:tetratricopeptide (TPR) repeat protein
MVDFVEKRRALVSLKALGSARTAVGILLLCAMTIVAYAPAWHGAFLWDDDRYVTHNPLLAAPDGLSRIWFSLDAPSQYFPLTYTVLRLARSIWGLNPTGYHALSLVLHIANAILLWRILLRLKLPGAWLAAAIFALHPVQVESVAWISELKNVLMGFFFLLTILMWVEYVDPRGRPSRFYYFAALAFYALALSAKSTACTLPAALVLILWLGQKRLDRKRLLEIAPFVLLAILFGLLAVWWEKYHQGTSTLVALNPIERVLVASRAIWFYLGKIFWPSKLTFIYPQWRIDPANPIAYSWLAACVASAVVIAFSGRFFGRGVQIAALFFVATLAPLLGFIMLYTFRYTFVADHYQYLACIGPIALLSAGLTRAWRRIGQGIGLSVNIFILCTLAFLTRIQSATYRDAETLWRSTISKNPRCWMAYNNLGVLEIEKGELDAAVANYEHSLALHPDYPEAHYNLASALLQKGEFDRALSECERALQLQPNDPDALIVLGNVYMAKHEVDLAIRAYERALVLRSADATAHYNLGAALSEKGDAARAAIEFERARQLEHAQER